jgi:hypothetical protein
VSAAVTEVISRSFLSKPVAKGLEILVLIVKREDLLIWTLEDRLLTS